MSHPTPDQQPGHVPGQSDPVALRTRAFIAFAAGILGALGGGPIGNAVSWLARDLEGQFGGPLSSLLPGAGLAGGFGLLAIVLGVSVRQSADPVAVPVARTAMLLGVVSLVGAALMVLAILDTGVRGY